MLIFYILFWFSMSYCAKHSGDVLDGEKRVELVFLNPEVLLEKKFNQQVTRLLADAAEETGEEIPAAHFYSSEKLHPETSLQEGIYKFSQKNPLAEKFWRQHKERLPEKFSKMAYDYIPMILQLLSRFVSKVPDDKEDALSEDVQLLNIFKSFYSEIWIPVDEALQKKLAEYKNQGELAATDKIDQVIYVQAVAKTLQENFTGLQNALNNANGSIEFSFEGINSFGVSIIENVTSLLEEKF